MMFEFDWDSCPGHDWKYPIDAMCHTSVFCTRCGMPGDRNEHTGEVFYPAT